MKTRNKNFGLLALLGALALNMSWQQSDLPSLFNNVDMASNATLVDCPKVSDSSEPSADNVVFTDREIVVPRNNNNGDPNFKLLFSAKDIECYDYSNRKAGDKKKKVTLTQVTFSEKSQQALCEIGMCEFQPSEKLPDVAAIAKKLGAHLDKKAKAEEEKAKEEEKLAEKEAKAEEKRQAQIDKLNNKVKECTHRWADSSVDDEERYDVDSEEVSKVPGVRKISDRMEKMQCLQARLEDDDLSDREQDRFKKSLFKELNSMVRSGTSTDREEAMEVLSEIKENYGIDSKTRVYADAMRGYAIYNERFAGLAKRFNNKQIDLYTYQNGMSQLGSNAWYELAASGNINDGYYGKWLDRLFDRGTRLMEDPDYASSIYGKEGLLTRYDNTLLGGRSRNPYDRDYDDYGYDDGYDRSDNFYSQLTALSGRYSPASSIKSLPGKKAPGSLRRGPVRPRNSY